jgi:hypothetical protein
MALQVLTLLRQLAFMVLVYLCLGWVVDGRIERPDSKVKAFFRLLCAPVTGPVARLLPAGAGYRRTLSVGIGAVAAAWTALVVATEVIRRS